MTLDEMSPEQLLRACGPTDAAVHRLAWWKAHRASLSPQIMPQPMPVSNEILHAIAARCARNIHTAHADILPDITPEADEKLTAGLHDALHACLTQRRFRRHKAWAQALVRDYLGSLNEAQI
jgi:hypothetical protein